MSDANIYAILENPVCTYILMFTVWRSTKAILEHKTKLYRYNSYKNIVTLPEEFRKREKVSSYEVTKVGIKKEASKCLSEFIEVMRDNPRADMAHFCKSCTPFSVDYTKKRRNGSYAGGGFLDAESNNILVGALVVRENIFHEFMHRLSTKIFGDCLFIGFKQIKYEVISGIRKIVLNVGTGINEAYTQLLTKRYFSDHGCNESAYCIITNLVLFVEDVLGYEKMEKFYFDADLYSLVQELSEYSNLESAINLVRMFDGLYYDLFENPSVINFAFAKKTFKQLITMIINMEVQKIKMDLQNDGSDTIAIFKDGVSLIDKLLNHRIAFKFKKVWKFNYEFTSKEIAELKERALEELLEFGLNILGDDAMIMTQIH